MATAKIENYTAEQTEKMVAEFTANPTKATVEMLATQMGKSARSVIAKLSRSGVYKSTATKPEAGKRGEKKDIVADAIGKVLGLPENDVASLTKANGSALKAIFEALANSKPF